MTANEGVSIIIPCYNSGVFVREAVESVLRQRFNCPFEVIVVDDASSDSITLQEIESLPDLPFVKLLRHPRNMGVQHARNTALEAAEFKYILPLDADDQLNSSSECLAKGTLVDLAVGLLGGDPGIAFVQSLVYMFGDFSGLTISAYPVTEDLIVRRHHVPTSIVYRKSDGLNCGGYDVSIRKWQDWAFGVALLNGRDLFPLI